jgi:hypothetical protein
MRWANIMIVLLVPAVARSQVPSNNLNIAGVPDPVWSTVGPHFNVTNTSTMPGYGSRLTYYTAANNRGFDLADARLLIARSIGTDHTAFLAEWLVADCPQETKAPWACVAGEINTVNRGDDQGWHPTRAEVSRLTGGLLAVPETTAFGEPGVGGNVLFGFAVAQSGASGQNGKHARTYNGLLVEQNSIGPNGRGIFLGGDTDGGTKLPYAPLQVDKRWETGLDTTLATFSDGTALHIASGQAVALNSSGTITVRFDPQTGRIVISSGAKRLFSIDPESGDLTLAGKITQGGSP